MLTLFYPYADLILILCWPYADLILTLFWSYIFQNCQEKSAISATLDPGYRDFGQNFEHFDFGFKFDDGVLSPPKLSRKKLKPYLDLDKEVDICRADEKPVLENGFQMSELT